MSIYFNSPSRIKIITGMLCPYLRVVSRRHDTASAFQNVERIRQILQIHADQQPVMIKEEKMKKMPISFLFLNLN